MTPVQLSTTQFGTVVTSIPSSLASMLPQAIVEPQATYEAQPQLNSHVRMTLYKWKNASPTILGIQCFRRVEQLWRNYGRAGGGSRRRCGQDGGEEPQLDDAPHGGRTRLLPQRCHQGHHVAQAR